MWVWGVGVGVGVGVGCEGGGGWVLRPQNVLDILEFPTQAQEFHRNS